VATGSAGVANAEIAVSLLMSEATVKAHVSHLLDKLDVRNRVQRAILVHDAGVAPDGLSPQEPTKSALACHSFVAALRSWLRRDDSRGWLLVK